MSFRLPLFPLGVVLFPGALLPLHIFEPRYRRLLASAAEADTSRAADPDLSAVTDAACRAYAGADCAGLPAKLKAAQDNTDQLIALQAWVAGQAVVVTSPETR